MQVQMTNEFGKDTYAFTANGTAYTVIDDNDGFYTVFSKRLNASFEPKLVVMTLKEMAARSKALRNLSALIAS